MSIRVHYIHAGLVLVASISLWLLYLAEGYFANPLLLGIVKFFFFDLAIALYCLVVPVVYLVKGFRCREDRRQIILAGIAGCALFFHPITPGLPRNLDAFHYRMSKFSDMDYDQLHAAAHAELSRLELNYFHCGGAPSDSGKAICDALIESSPMLRIGPHRPYINVRNNQVSFHWGSGLTGAYVVSVYADRSDRDCESTEMSDVRCLYDRVALKYST